MILYDKQRAARSYKLVYYFLERSNLERVDNAKFFGVTIDENLN